MMRVPAEVLAGPGVLAVALLVADQRAGWVALTVLAGLARVVWILVTGARNGRSRAAEKGHLRGSGSLVFRLALPGAARPGAIFGDLGVGCPPPGC